MLFPKHLSAAKSYAWCGIESDSTSAENCALQVGVTDELVELGTGTAILNPQSLVKVSWEFQQLEILPPQSQKRKLR